MGYLKGKYALFSLTLKEIQLTTRKVHEIIVKDEYLKFLQRCNKSMLGKIFIYKTKGDEL